MPNQKIYNISQNLLTQLYGEKAQFREGQYEAIEASLTYKRTLIVQKTGWGKSLVYFLATKLLRLAHKGCTIVISPLLVLMDNQIDAAQKIGLKCAALNSKTKEMREETIALLLANELDMLFVTPESLFAQDVQAYFSKINIGLFVIDEAHCISSWGHDFRLQYRNIYKVLATIPLHVPVLATTATANDNVIKDLKEQLGSDVFISRGELMRKSLSIQVLHLPELATRYAWILENINKLNGSGIIYCLTQRDCDHLTNFLRKNKINARSYYSRVAQDEELNREAEILFLNNKIKVLVATIKLGMGYDKGDIAFVIHLQSPSNIVSYYQQIGRAGRNIARAYTFLMTGQEDKDIQNYFIETAFPTKEEATQAFDTVFKNTDEGITLSQLLSQVNLRHQRAEKALMFLENEGYIIKNKTKYHATIKKFMYNEAYYQSITDLRRKEQEQMEALCTTSSCYNKFTVNCLDDMTEKVCGICANCAPSEAFDISVSADNLEKAQIYLSRLLLSIEPRQKWATTKYTRQTKIPRPNEIGICLAKYGEDGYGKQVKQGKYSQEQVFSHELIGKSVSILKELIRENRIDALTFVPSLRTPLVANFAQEVAQRCGIPCIQCFEKTQAQQQKSMNNSSFQCENALTSFHLLNVNIPAHVLLIDDIIDSRWTMTVCGNLLAEAGALKIFPFALADSSNKEV